MPISVGPRLAWLIIAYCGGEGNGECGVRSAECEGSAIGRAQTLGQDGYLSILLGPSALDYGDLSDLRASSNCLSWFTTY